MTSQAPAVPSTRFRAGEECWSIVAGSRMRYLRAGSGPPLILIHGLMGYSFSWRHNIAEFARHFTVYAIDLPGIGYSERPQRNSVPFDLTSIAERLLQWMRDLGLQSTHLVGTSHGGGIAILMADLDRRHGTHLIDKLVLVAPINPWSSVGRRRTRFFAHPFGAFCMRRAHPLLALIRHWALSQMYGDPSRITPETRAGYDAPLTLPGTVDYLLGIVQYWHRDLLELEHAISRIADMPALLLWGSADAAVPLPSAHQLHRRMPNSRLEVLNGVGHLPYEESPEEFNRILLNYLLDTGSQTSPISGRVAGKK